MRKQLQQPWWSMVKHGMVVQHRATEFLNPGQIPVTVFDAPLYALAKQVQWKWPDTHGEEKYWGGSHWNGCMEHNWRLLGSFWCLNSSWNCFFMYCWFLPQGCTPRHGHQVCAVALSKLQHDAFLSSDEENIKAWRQKVEKSPTFQFWDTVLRMEIMGFSLWLIVKLIFWSMVLCIGSSPMFRQFMPLAHAWVLMLSSSSVDKPATCFRTPPRPSQPSSPTWGAGSSASGSWPPVSPPRLPGSGLALLELP